MLKLSVTQSLTLNLQQNLPSKKKKKPVSVLLPNKIKSSTSLADDL
jgi:hypothetical protein